MCAADGNFVNSLMDLHMGPLMLLGGWAAVPLAPFLPHVMGCALDSGPLVLHAPYAADPGACACPPPNAGPTMDPRLLRPPVNECL